MLWLVLWLMTLLRLLINLREVGRGEISTQRGAKGSAEVRREFY